MIRRATFQIILVFIVLTVVGSCAPRFQMETPTAFSRFDESDAVKMITAEGVRLRVREVANDSEATLAFWTEAMRTHMKKQGYIVGAEDCFQTMSAVDGCTLDMVIPYGSEDWVLSETIFVVGDAIYLVEAAGPFELFQEVDSDLKTALRSFSIH